MKTADMHIAIRKAQDEAAQAKELMKAAKEHWQTVKEQVSETKALAKSAKKNLKKARKQVQRAADKEQDVRDWAKERQFRSARFQRISAKEQSGPEKSLDQLKIAGSPERRPAKVKTRRAAIERREWERVPAQRGPIEFVDNSGQLIKIAETK